MTNISTFSDPRGSVVEYFFSDQIATDHPSLQTALIQEVASQLPFKEAIHFGEVNKTSYRAVTSLNSKAKRFKEHLKTIGFLPEEEVPSDTRTLPETLSSFDKLDAFIRARDALVVWRELAKACEIKDGVPEFSDLKSSQDFILKANEFKQWIDKHPKAMPSSLHLERQNLTYLPTELGALKSLKTLFLFQNFVSDLTPLQGLTNLENLNLNLNQITDLSPLSSLVGLKNLALSCNQIVDLKPLSNLLKLQMLWLIRNAIVDVSPLFHLTNLKEIRLMNNSIQTMKDLRNLPAELIIFSENPISDRLEREEHYIRRPCTYNKSFEEK